MIAKSQYKLEARDLEIILALVRTANLARAGERLNVDASTIFRAIRRIERGLGHQLFERSRAGYLPSEQAQVLAEHAEQVETQLEQARSAIQLTPEQVSGTVRIATTDTLLHGLLAPALHKLANIHPLLEYELHTGNALTSLTRREADIAVRATNTPPLHLVGKQIGPIRMALNGSNRIAYDQQVESAVDWIVADIRTYDEGDASARIVLALRKTDTLDLAESVTAHIGANHMRAKHGQAGSGGPRH